MEQQSLVVSHRPYHSEPLRPSVSGISNLAALKGRIDLRGLYHELTGNSAGGDQVRSRGRRGVRVLCPFHSDSDPSLVIYYDGDDQFYHCFSCKTSGDCIAMVMELRETDFLGAMQFLGLRGEIQFDDSQMPDAAPKKKAMTRVDRTYDFVFTDEEGTALYKEVRMEGLKSNGKLGKTIAYRHPDPGQPGNCSCCLRYFPDDPTKWNFHIRGWGFGIDGVRQVPFRLPELRARAAAGRDITVVEGPNKARLLAYGRIFATTNVGASGFVYPDEWMEHFQGVARAFVFTDCDQTGRTAALDRTAFLRRCGVDALFCDPDPSRNDGYDVGNIVREARYDPEQIRAACGGIVDQSRTFQPVEILLTNREDIEDTVTRRVFPLNRTGLDASRAVLSHAVTIERPVGEKEQLRSTRFYDEINEAYARRDVPVIWVAQPSAPAIVAATF
jgi:CHC2 zinc finger